MKKFINILLAICAIGLIYTLYESIMDPIRFANEKGRRDKAVINRLLDIRDAQIEYNHAHSTYCDDFDTLIAFVKSAKLPIIRKIGNLTDDQMDALWTEGKVLDTYDKARAAERLAATLTGSKAAKKKIEADTLWQKVIDAGFVKILADGSKEFLFSRDTAWVDLVDSLYHGQIDPDSLCYVPFGNGAKFELATASDTSKSGVITNSFYAYTPFVTYLGGLDEQEIINLLEDCDDRGRDPGMKVDNNSGNWE
ncbi:MAG: hypothetical protein IKZ89_08975 [Bacteroidaceae bacterium]|nr:hypothetical protein [Bacteroidaceae bacterium]